MKQFFSFVKKAFYFLKTCLSNSIGAIGQIKNRVLDYLERKDWRERENANTIYSLAQLEKYLAGHEVAEYCLENLYKGDIADAHRNGYLHIHDLNMGIAAYCCGFDTYLILSKGFPPAISNTACSAPPKHFSSALGQLVNFIGTVSNEIAGAVALNDFDVLLAPYLELDELSDREIYQRLQEFIYSINVPSRFSQCVDEETEVLTKDGWKKYYQLTKDDIIATLNVEKDQIEFLKIESLNVFDYEGKMIYLKNRKVEQLVTPNHRVLRQKFNYKNNKYEFNFAKDIKKFKTRIIIPLSGKTASTKKIDDNLIKLAAWIVAEGSFDRGNIRIFKSTKYPEKIKEIRTILTNLGYSFSEYVRKKEDISKHPSYINGHLVKHNYDIVSFVIHKESSNEIKKLLVREKKIPNFIKDLSSEQIKLFIDTYLNLDGDKKSRIYVNEYNKDQLQALCALCNYGCTARKKGTCWVVRITKPVAHITQVKEVNYKGKVWCPTTKNGTFVARRNEKIFITGNSPFVNLTIDFTVPDYLKNLPVIAGKPLDITYGEYRRLQALMNRINRNLLKLLIKGDSQGRPFTFPVITINITKDFKQRVPEDIQELLWKWTAYKGGGYYQNMISSDLDVSDIRSMCCFDGSQCVIWRKNGKKHITEFRKLYWQNERYGTEKDDEIETLCNGKWIKAKVIQVPYEKEFYKIKLRNGLEIIVTDDHLHLTKKGLKKTIELSTEDYLAWSKQSPDWDGIGNYDFGYFLGLYLAEGSPLGEGIQFSINENALDIVKFLQEYTKYLGVHLSIFNNKGKSKTLAIHSQWVQQLIKTWIGGNKGPEKFIKNWVKLSKDALQGLWDGWVKGDGKEDGTEVYTTSFKLAKQMMSIANLLNIPVNLRVKERTVKISDRVYIGKIYALYTCKIKNGRIYEEDNNYYWVKIENISTVPNNSKTAYCFVVDTKEHLFELPEGLITHNCRLRLDLTELKRNVGTSIGGSSPQTGSLGVVDINLPLIAQNYKFRFFQALIGYVNLACVALIKKRQIVDKLWKYGLFPYLRHYLKDFSHHFLTVSVQGAWEAWIFLGKPDNFTDFCLKIANIVRQEILKWQQKTGYLFNWEEAPGEGCCYRFAKFLKNYDKQFITNGLKLPVDYSDDLYDYIKHYDKILPLFTGGSMFLIFVGEKLQPYSVWPLIRMLTYKTKIPYFAITPTFSYCPKCKCTYQGKMEKCIECGTACEIYDRVVGYYRPTKLWNKGKQEEFQNRKRFNLNNKSP